MANVNVSNHPCVKTKLSILRSASTNARDTKTLIHEIATIVGVEAFARGLSVQHNGTVCQYPPVFVSPDRLTSLVRQE